VPDLVLRLGPRGGSLDVRVVDLRGEPVAGAAVQLGNNYGFEPPYPDEPAHSGRLPYRTLITDTAGRALAEDVPVLIVPVLVRAAGFSPWNTSLEVTSGEIQRVDVRLEAGASVEGQVTNSAGEPAENANITLGMDVGFGTATTATGSDGRFTIPDAPLGEQRIVAKGAEGRDCADLDIGAGTRLVWNASLGEEPRGLAGHADNGQQFFKIIVPVQLTCHRDVPPAGRLLVTAANGNLIESRSLHWLPAPADAHSHVMRASLDLAVGTFDLRIETGGTQILQQAVIVEAGSDRAPLLEPSFD
jgi:hypothetical protein